MTSKFGKEKSFFIRLVILILSIVIIEKSSAQYDIDMMAINIMVPNDTKTFNIDKVKLKRFGRNQPHVITGEVEMFVAVSDNVNVQTYVYQKQGQEYRKTPYHMKGKPCEMLKIENPITQQLWKYTDLPPYETCPFPPGVYHVNNLYLGNMTGLPAIISSGDYMTNTTIYDKNNNFLQGFQIYANVYNRVLGAAGK